MPDPIPDPPPDPAPADAVGGGGSGGASAFPGGFAAPADPAGAASLYGPPPWRFAGRSLTVIARCPAEPVRALLPPPLELLPGPEGGAPLVRFSVHSLACDFGYGWPWAQAHPERAQFHEAVVGIAARRGETVGFWDPFLWTDSDAELAVGREMYGWPQRQGTLALTAPHPQAGWAAGDRCTGLVSRLGRPVLEAAVTLAAPRDLDLPQPPFVGFFVERILPEPAAALLRRELYLAEMRAVSVADPWSGPATLALHAPELAPLAPLAVLGGRVNTVSWIKGGARLLARSERPFPRPVWP